MKFTVSRSAFLSALAPCTAITNRRSPSPFGSCVLLTAARPSLVVRVVDSISAVRAEVPAEVPTAGAVAVPAEELTNRIAALTDGPIDIAIKAGKLTIKQGKGIYLLRTLPTDSYPAFPAAPTTTATLSGAALATVLNGVSYAVGDDQSRANLMGMVLTSDGAHLHGTASDGHRFSRTSVACAETVSTFVPDRAVKVLSAAIGREDPRVTVATTDRAAYFAIERDGLSVAYAYTIPDVKAPNFDSFFAMVKEKQGPSVSRRDLLARLRAVTPDGVTGCTPVWLRADGSLLRVEHTNVDGEPSTDELAVNGSKWKWSVVAEGKYLLDALGHMAGDDVTIGVTEAEVMQPVWLQGDNSCAMIGRMDPAQRAEQKEAA